jgi:hypothetical protein
MYMWSVHVRNILFAIQGQSRGREHALQKQYVLGRSLHWTVGWQEDHKALEEHCVSLKHFCFECKLLLLNGKIVPVLN